MWADTETEIDFLNYTEIAELITELISRPDLLPLSLGVFGGWGVGKSSTLRLVERGLASSENYVVVRFDAWLYQGFDDARSALMSVIAGDLLTVAPPTLKEKAKSLFSRVDKLRALGLLVEGGAAAFGVPTFGLAAKGVRSLGDVLSGTADEEDVKSIEKAAADTKDKVAGLLTKGAAHDPPNEIAAFRREFGEVLSGLDKKLVVFIDNLDRCLPENAIYTLEAVRLFLFLPNTAFVIAADEDMIRHAVAYHFKNPGERHVTDYLDKLIQIPVRVPRLGVQEIRAYLFLLLAGVEIKDSALREKLRSYLVAQLQVTWREDQGFAVSDVLRVIDRAQDESPDAWARTFEIILPLVNPSAWDAVKPLLQRTLRFLSGDHWSFEFVAGGMLPPSLAEIRRRREAIDISKVDCVSLFSGGLDSAIGAIDLLKLGARPLLVSHSPRGDATAQEEVAGLLPAKLQRFAINSYPTWPGVDDDSMRTRSFQFIALGALAGSAISSFRGNSNVELYVCENGLIALNPPLTPRRLGSHSTRTAHPYFLIGVRKIVSILGLPIENPQPLRI